MAAMAAPPPPSRSPPASPSHHMPLQNISTTSSDWAETIKTMPTVPPPAVESPRLRQPPISPVRVSFQPEDWAKPSNANIETGSSLSFHSAATNITGGGSDRTLPNSPGAAAPTPPPHTPNALGQPTFTLEPPPAVASPNSQGRQLVSRSLPLLNVHPAGKPEATNGHPETSSTQGSSVSQVSQVSQPSPGLAVPSKMGQQVRMVAGDADRRSTSDVAFKGPDGANRLSRETNGTTSTGPKQASAGSSATTSASSVSGVNDPTDSAGLSPESSLEDGNPGRQQPTPQPVPQLQYHHQAFLQQSASMDAIATQAQFVDPRSSSNPDLLGGGPTNRLLTPNSQAGRRTSLARPQSSYSVYSDMGPRGRSPGLYGASIPRGSSNGSRGSPDVRMSTYADMLNVPYPQPAPAPITLDNTQLRTAVGTNASLLSVQKTLEMYRQNLKKTNDMSIQYSFAVFLISTAQEQGLTSYDESAIKRKPSPKPGRGGRDSSPYVENIGSSPQELAREARSILQRLSNAGYPFAQYYLADGYASGLFSKGKEDYNAAFPLFVLAAKHGHAESAYRTALCYEFGWGCRKDPAKAVQYLRTASAKRHPGAMTRLGKACLSGDLGERRYREGIKWLKLATESADAIYNGAPYHLGCLYETGYGDDIFKDESYAAELFTQAAELGHPDANYRMGDAYEHGRLNCPRDPSLSVHFYTGAAERGHPAAMMCLCAWYMVGAEPLLERDEEEAYEWAKRSAELGYVKAQYAVGYFTEMGIGCRRDILEANVWYVKAADAGDERAKLRLKAIRTAVSGGDAIAVGGAAGIPMEVAPPRNGKVKKHNKDTKENKEKDDNCVVM